MLVEVCKALGIFEGTPRSQASSAGLGAPRSSKDSLLAPGAAALGEFGEIGHELREKHPGARAGRARTAVTRTVTVSFEFR